MKLEKVESIKNHISSQIMIQNFQNNFKQIKQNANDILQSIQNFFENVRLKQTDFGTVSQQSSKMKFRTKVLKTAR